MKDKMSVARCCCDNTDPYIGNPTDTDGDGDLDLDMTVCPNWEMDVTMGGFTNRLCTIPNACADFYNGTFTATTTHTCSVFNCNPDAPHRDGIVCCMWCYKEPTFGDCTAVGDQTQSFQLWVMITRSAGDYWLTVNMQNAKIWEANIGPSLTNLGAISGTALTNVNDSGKIGCWAGSCSVTAVQVP